MQVKNCVFSKVDFLRLMQYSNGFGVFVGSVVRWSRQQMSRPSTAKEVDQGP